MMDVFDGPDSGGIPGDRAKITNLFILNLNF